MCHAADAASVASISTRDLVCAYRAKLDIDVSSYFGVTRLDVLQCRLCGLQFYFPPAIGGPEFYRALSRFDFYYMTDKAEFQAAYRFIGAGARVLEVGGGTGAFGRSLPRGHYVGLEANEEAASIAREHGLTMLSQQFEEHARENAARYDVVCAFQVLEHLADPAEFVRSAVIAMKENGKLIVSVPNSDAFVGHVVNDVLNAPPHHATRWGDQALLSLARLFSLEIEHIEHERLAPYHYSWFLSALVRNILSAQGKLGGPVFETGPAERAKARTYRAIGTMLAACLAPILKRVPAAFLPLGHTVIAVYRKA